MFTLGTALAWLGHECPGDCPQNVTGRRADVWYTVVDGTDRARWAETLVDVDFVNSPEHLHLDSLVEINDCVRSDRIRVRDRTAPDRMALLSRFPGPRALPVLADE
jgi:hypothetical protein